MQVIYAFMMCFFIGSVLLWLKELGVADFIILQVVSDSNCLQGPLFEVCP